MLYQEIVNFIRSEFETSEFIPLHVPRFNGREKEFLNACIDSTYVSSVGKFVDLFEKTIAEITETARGVAVVNGTAALQVALRLSGVREKEEVITQSLTFVATANAILYNKAYPVFLDVDIDTMGLSPRAVEEFLEEYGEIRDGFCYNKKSGARIAACMPMHTFGFPVHLDELIRVCEKWHIPLVEDAAESLGSLYKGKPTGSFGKISAISFNGNKIVTSGGGGVIITKDEDLASKAKFLTTTAKQPHAYEYIHNELGYNFRMPNLNAALLNAQLEQLEGFLSNKRELALNYKDFFIQKGIKFRTELENTKANYWLMAIELENKAERDQFLKYTNDNKVMTRPIWKLMYKLPMYQNFYRDHQKNALFLEDRIVNIPSSVR